MPDKPTRGFGARMAATVFPASAIVIVFAYLVTVFTDSELPEQVTAALTGLVAWGAVVFLGAGEK